jgi:hypothetical protein
MKKWVLFFAQRSVKCGCPHGIIKWNKTEYTRSNFPQHSTQEAGYENKNKETMKYINKL